MTIKQHLPSLIQQNINYLGLQAVLFTCWCQQLSQRHV